MFDNLPTPQYSEDIRPMEQFNQGWGQILYRTTLPQLTDSTEIKITEVHDWAQVFVNGKLIARLDRRLGQFSTKLPPVRKGAQLDILV